MKEDDGTIQQTNDLIHSQILEFNARQRKKSNKNLVFILLWVVGGIIFLYALLYVLKVPFGARLVVIISIMIVISWIMSIPYLGVLAIITFRTKHPDFALQLLTFLQLAIMPIFFIIGFSVTDSYDAYGYDAYGVGLFITSLPMIIGLISSILIEKPIFWQISRLNEYYSSTILSQHALRIRDRHNGYSQRPFFSNFHEIRSYCSSSADFQLKIESYVRFLNHNGALIGWKIHETTAVLNPRVLTSLPNLPFPFDIRSLYQLLIRVYTKKDLTTVTINFATEEVSLHINRDDYNELGDVTYHILGEQVLKRIKQSIVAFMQKDLCSSYSALFPVDPEIKNIIQKQELARPKFLVLPVGVEILLGSLISLYGFFALIIASLLAIIDVPIPFLPNFILGSIFYILIGIGFVVIGLKLWKLNKWAWITSLFMSGIISLWFVCFRVWNLFLFYLYLFFRVGEIGNLLWLILPLAPLIIFYYLLRIRTCFLGGTFTSNKL